MRDEYRQRWLDSKNNKFYWITVCSHNLFLKIVHLTLWVFFLLIFFSGYSFVNLNFLMFLSQILYNLIILRLYFL